MEKHSKKCKHKISFDAFATQAAKATGSTTAFILAFVTVIVWAVTGPLFDYSETWQLVINTGTTIITFLMVFLIQKAQNKDSLAIQLKLNELVASHELASNRLVDIEDMTEAEMETIKELKSMDEVLPRPTPQAQKDLLEKLAKGSSENVDEEIDEEISAS